MRVLLTGATGRIGRAVIRRLHADGHAVTALILPDDPHADAVGDAEVFTAGLADRGVLEEACAEVDAIVHLAGLMAWTVDDYDRLYEINVTGTYNLLYAALRSGRTIRRVVLAGSDATYPADAAEYRPIDEQHPQRPYSFYGMTKQLIEPLAAFFSRSHQLPAAVCRFAYAIDPSELAETGNPHVGHMFYLSARLKRIESRASQRQTGSDALGRVRAAMAPDGSERIMALCGDDGTPWEFSMTHVDDIARGIVLCLEREEAVDQAFNLGPPSSFSYQAAAEHLAHRLGLEAVQVRLPGPAVRYAISIEKARSLLGYEPMHDIFSIIDAATPDQ